jgi:hypothetical protein
MLENLRGKLKIELQQIKKTINSVKSPRRSSRFSVPNSANKTLNGGLRIEVNIKMFAFNQKRFTNASSQNLLERSVHMTADICEQALLTEFTM